MDNHIVCVYDPKTDGTINLRVKAETFDAAKEAAERVGWEVVDPECRTPRMRREDPPISPSSLGTAAMALSVTGLLVVLFAPAGIVLGFAERGRTSGRSGTAAIVVGAIAIFGWAVVVGAMMMNR